MLFTFYAQSGLKRRTENGFEKINLQVYWSRNFCTLFFLSLYTLQSRPTDEKRTADTADWPAPTTTMRFYHDGSCLIFLLKYLESEREIFDFHESRTVANLDAKSVHIFIFFPSSFC